MTITRLQVGKLGIINLLYKGRDVTISSIVQFETQKNPAPYFRISINSSVENSTTIGEYRVSYSTSP